jgi:hypothetical protein
MTDCKELDRKGNKEKQPVPSHLIWQLVLIMAS